LHVLIRDDLVDHDYVQRHTIGFDELAEQVRSWTPARTAEVTGVDAAEVEAVARMYGSTTPAFIRTLIGPEHREHGAMFFRTLACLPAVTGAWKHRGGGLARSVGSWNASFIDEGVFDAPHLWPGGTAPRGINMNHLGRALTHPRLDPRVMALVVWNANPAVTAPRSSLVREGLARDDLFTVVSEQFPTDTVRYADVVFPATTQVEHVDVVPAWGHLYVGWNEPAIAPVGEAVPNTELWRRLATALGFDEPELFDSDDELIAQAMAGFDLDELRRQGFARLPVSDDLRPWTDGGVPTPSGRIELMSSGLAARGHDALPEYRVPAEGWGSAMSQRFPLALLTPKTQVRFLNSSYSPLPGHGDREGQPTVELHAADAEVRQIADGDWVRVFNDRGSLELVARVRASGEGRGRAGVVVVPFGWWRHQHRDDGVANDLTSDTLADWGGGVAYYDVSVEVQRLESPGGSS
jgi:anaerobic selenocysteine-containing dehydrogenase